MVLASSENFHPKLLRGPIIEQPLFFIAVSDPNNDSTIVIMYERNGRDFT